MCIVANAPSAKVTKIAAIVQNTYGIFIKTTKIELETRTYLSIGPAVKIVIDFTT